MATLSLLGLYNHDESLLDGLIENLPNKFGIPSGYEDSYYTDITVDPQTVVENLLLECAEFEILYADFNALKRIIKIWSAKEKPVWQKMFNTTCYKYNPIWNKDGKTRWTERQTGSGTKQEKETGTKTNTGTSTITDEYTSNTTESEKVTDDYVSSSNTTNKTTGTGKSSRSGTGKSSRSGQDETTGKISAYNSTDFQNREKTNTNTSENNSTESSENNNTESSEDFTGTGKVTNSGTKTTDGSGKVSNSGKKSSQNSTDETNNVSRETIDSNTGETIHEQTETGNIGVTMTQQMITAEREIAVFNIIDFIINDFKERFCLRIY